MISRYGKVQKTGTFFKVPVGQNSQRVGVTQAFEGRGQSSPAANHHESGAPNRDDPA
jgi:hypothetical protein